MSFLRLEGLYKQYPNGIRALENLSLEISRGDRLAVIGESGSGKSTLLKIIAGLEKPDSGKVFLQDQPILHPDEKLVPGYDEIQLVRQDNGLFPNSTVAENIGRPLLSYDKVYGKERLEVLLQIFGLAEKKDQYPRQLSGGQQQKVGIARALSNEPEVLLLDEPFSSLDTLQKRRLMSELNLIFQQIKVALILVTHDIQDALILTDELCVLRRGKLIRKGSPEALYRDPQNTYTAEFFGPLNPIPGKAGQFIRSSSVRVDEKKGKISGVVLFKKFLPLYDLITIKIPDLDQYWQVESSRRDIQQGRTIFLDWSHREALNLKTAD
ncbi:MAG: ABC transporter ATP-binding protein [Cyclobacteriaceae bacterium]